jgi:hypothetical protein
MLFWQQKYMQINRLIVAYPHFYPGSLYYCTVDNQSLYDASYLPCALPDRHRQLFGVPSDVEVELLSGSKAPEFSSDLFAMEIP